MGFARLPMGDKFSSEELVGSFSNDDGDGNENASKRFDEQKQALCTLHVRFKFWYISLPSSANNNVK